MSRVKGISMRGIMKCGDGSIEGYVVRMDGEKVRMFKDVVVARAWANKHCHGEVEIVALRQTTLPKASRTYYNELFENKSAYRYNPFVAVE